MINKLADNEVQLIQAAIDCLEKRLSHEAAVFYSPLDVKQYLHLQLGMELNEVFAVLFLDNQMRLLAFERLFQGTINSATVYPRVVIQKVLAYNAARVILVHNHPSGNLQPSVADKELTQRLKSILELLDVIVLDHFIVSSQGGFSFIEADLL